MSDSIINSYQPNFYQKNFYKTGYVLLAKLIVFCLFSNTTLVSAAENRHQLANLQVRENLSQSYLLATKILLDSDITTYTKIFKVQKTGAWSEADKLIKTLKNKTLMGHVLYQRYMHPTMYRSTYNELKNWMKKYFDHPGAKRVYKLALRRKPKNWRSPKLPQKIPFFRGKEHTTSKRLPYKKQARSLIRKARALRMRVKRSLNNGHTLTAKNLLLNRNTKMLLSASQYDELQTLLGKGYFIDGRDDWALKWAGAAVKRSGHLFPEANWIVGLASWRQGQKLVSAQHFEQAAMTKGTPPWLASASAFWAARSYLASENPEKTIDLLERASMYPRTFYGLLANRLLGNDMPFYWSPPTLSDDTLLTLKSLPGGRRGLALLQIGKIRLAELELSSIAKSYGQQLSQGILSLAVKSGMASLAVTLDRKLAPSGLGYDGAAYPVPAWEPDRGFIVDRALVYALIRQESKFNPKAKSRAGARGLMQLMPRTAQFIARTNGIKWRGQKSLETPGHNLELGQRYINILLNDAKIQGNLFMMLTAWNGGPGNLNKWRRKTNFQDDPLLFIESIPSRETRNFIERALSNLWIYRDRLNQATPSLDALARGDWPLYSALGQGSSNYTE